MLRLSSAFTGGFTFRVLQALTELPEEILLNCFDEAFQAGLPGQAAHGGFTGRTAGPPRFLQVPVHGRPLSLVGPSRGVER